MSDATIGDRSPLTEPRPRTMPAPVRAALVVGLLYLFLVGVKMLENGVKVENIFVDPLVQPLSVNKEFGMQFIEAIGMIHATWPGIHTACGLSNISFGLPGRRHINSVFMTMAISRGLDGAIVNPLDKEMVKAITIAEALAGRDDYCMNYLKAFRGGLLEN